MRARLIVVLTLAACGESDDRPTPDTQIETQPAALTNVARAEFGFRAVGAANGFLCTVDSGDPIACVPPFAIDLADGQHTFSVAASLDFKVDETPATYAWQIDTIAPATRLVSAPPAIDNDTTPEFAFEGDDAEGTVTFECALDGAAAAPCTSPFGLADVLDGEHSFAIAAVDAAGNRDASPIVHGWRITTIAPDTEITLAPDVVTGPDGISFQFTSPDPLATFECALDAAAFAACTSPVGFDDLANGAHTFSVRAIATAGADPSPATRAWTVDAVAPVVTLQTTPGNPSNDATPQFVFTANEAATFECEIAGVVAFAPCVSPFTAPSLADGNRTFRVRATDAVGNLGNILAFAWAIDTVAPTVTITAAPPVLGNDTTPSVTFTTAGSPATIRCATDGGAPATCTSPFTTSTLADGDHAVAITVTDAAGNSNTAATGTFVIDTLAPTAAFTTVPSALSNNNDPSAAFTVAGAPVTIQCRLNAGTFAACTSPFSLTNVADGNHTISVRVTDGAGNTSTTTTASFTIDTVAPTVAISAEPAAVSNNNDPSVTFTTGGAPTAIECRLDTGTFAACTSPHAFANVPDGNHTITVRVTDGATNTASDTTASFAIDTVAPTVSITSQPGALTNDTSPTVVFTTAGAPATTRCQLDGGALVTCAPPSFTTTAGTGTHTITITVTDAAGNAASATTGSFTIDTTAPVASFVDAPPAQWPVNYYDVQFTANETSTFECSLNSGAFTTCTSPHSITTVYDQLSTFRVRATDGLGNVSATIQTTWTSSDGLVLHYPWEQGGTENTSLLSQRPVYSPDGSVNAVSTFLGGWAGSALGNTVAAHTYPGSRRALSSSPIGHYTVSFWVRASDGAQGTSLFSTLGATGGMRVSIGTAGNMLVEVRNPNGGLSTAQAQIGLGRWVHVALVSTGPDKGVLVFIDGLSRIAVNSIGTGFDAGQVDLTVGPFNGVDLDDLRFFNRSHSSTEACLGLARGFFGIQSLCFPNSPGIELDFESDFVDDTGFWGLFATIPQGVTFPTGKLGDMLRLSTGSEWRINSGFRSNVNSVPAHSFSLWFLANNAFGPLIDFTAPCVVGGPPGTCGISLVYTGDGVTVFTGTDSGIQKSTLVPVAANRMNSIVVTEQKTDPKRTETITVYVNGVERARIAIGAGNIYEDVSDLVQMPRLPNQQVDEIEFWPSDLSKDSEALCENGFDGQVDHVDGSCTLTAN